MAIQNEFTRIKQIIEEEHPDQLRLTNVKPAPDHVFDSRMGIFSQWPRGGIPMSGPWERKTRELLARWMTTMIVQHWIALDRPSTMNVWRAVTTRDTTKVMCFLDL